MTALLLLRAYWKLAVAALLVAAVGIQTYRLQGARADLAACGAAQSVFEADLAAQHAMGVAEGVRQQQAAQAALDARRANMAAERVRQAEARAKAADARSARLAKLLSEAKQDCLLQPLDEGVLNEFRQ